MALPKTQWLAVVAAGLALAVSACAGGDPASTSLPDDAQVAADVPAMVADVGADAVDASADVSPDSPDAALDSAQDQGCPTDWPDACAQPVPSWMNSVQPIINKRCNPCHFPGGIMYRAVDLSNYMGVHGNYPTIQLVEEACAMPPFDAGQPTRAERETLVAWLVCGAPNN